MPDSILDFQGPEFLVLYFMVGAGVLLYSRARLRARELEDAVPRIDLKDALGIAYLRGGAREVLRVATFSLVDRGLLVFDGRTLCTKPRIASTLVRRPLEKALIERFLVPGRPSAMFTDARLRSACDEYAEALRAHTLIATQEIYAARRPIFLLGLLVLVGLAGTKIVVAWNRGHHNVGFLSILALFFLVALYHMYRRPRTARGDEALANLKVLLAGRKSQSKFLQAGGANDDAILLAAVYGFGALPANSFPYLRKLFPKDPGSSNSCGSSCGSGCGGGGCGGGCGGCGS